METKNFNQVLSVSNEVTNRQTLNNTTKGAREEIKGLSIMYYVNQLNKLARKNEFVEGINIRDLGRLVKTLHDGKEPFAAYLFTKDSNNRPSFVAISKKCPLWGFDLVDISMDGWQYLKPVNLSLSGLISAYRAILAPIAATQDKKEREAKKAESATARKARIAAQKALKEEQTKARIDYKNGKIDINTFAAIMSKVA